RGRGRLLLGAVRAGRARGRPRRARRGGASMTEPSAAPERPLLEVWGLHKKFGTLEVLVDVCLKLHRGKTMCLLGPSGSGKSTLLRCINRLERPDDGMVLLDGQRVGYRKGSD